MIVKITDTVKISYHISTVRMIQFTAVQRTLWILSIFLIFISCNSRNRWSAEIEEVLRQAGDNRKELETVLQHYKENPADSLKFRAAEFLIVKRSF
jgi:hypothetical protein